MLYPCPASQPGPLSPRAVILSCPAPALPRAALCTDVAGFYSQKEELWQRKSHLGQKLLSWLGCGGSEVHTHTQTCGNAEVGRRCWPEEQCAWVPALAAEQCACALLLQNPWDLGGREDANPGTTFSILLAWGFVRPGFLVGVPLWA